MRIHAVLWQLYSSMDINATNNLYIAHPLSSSLWQFYDAVSKGDVKHVQQMVSEGLNPSDILVTAQDKQSAIQVCAVSVCLES